MNARLQITRAIPVTLGFALLISGCGSGGGGSSSIGPTVGGSQTGGNGYSIVDLGTLGGSTSSANAINNAGQVVGIADASGGVEHGFLWLGSMMNMGSIDGYPNSEATSINASGAAVGGCDADPTIPPHAFTFRGTLTDLGTTDGGSGAWADAINDSGEVAGYVIDSDGDQHAFISPAGGSMTDIGTLPGGAFSEAFGVNGSGQAVGYSGINDTDEHAFLYDGSMRDLGTLGGPNSEAQAINASGAVVGSSDVGGGDSHAFVWSSGSMRDLGTFGGSDSFAYDINATGSIVGGAFDSSENEHAFLSSGGALIDLNSLLPASSGWVLVEAHGINDAGQIVGDGIHNGIDRGFLLTPPSRTGSVKLF